MKTRFAPANRFNPLRGELGMATFVVLTLLAILQVLVASNVASLRQFQRETRLIERRQLERLRAFSANTNAPTAGPHPGPGPATP